MANSEIRIGSLASDLDHILSHTRELWAALRGGRIFITGGTGFLGCWLLESLAWANERLNLNASAVVLTRSPEVFRGKAPHLAGNAAVQLHRGDVRSFEFPEGEFTHVIHAAATASTAVNEQDPLGTVDTIVEGTRRTLDLAARSRAPKFLFVSSGAVYGKARASVEGISEASSYGPDVMSTRSAYAEGKRMAELLCAIYRDRESFETKVARCFTFIGPYMALDSSFAAGNFLRDRLRNMPIRVLGDGTSVRSYLYAADAAIWLWTILLKGEPCRPYNVGSEIPLRIAELAAAVSKAGIPEVPVEITKKPSSAWYSDRYVPSTRRAQSELGLEQWISVEEAVRRSLCWFEARKTAQEAAVQ